MKHQYVVYSRTSGLERFKPHKDVWPYSRHRWEDFEDAESCAHLIKLLAPHIECRIVVEDHEDPSEEDTLPSMWVPELDEA